MAYITKKRCTECDKNTAVEVVQDLASRKTSNVCLVCGYAWKDHTSIRAEDQDEQDEEAVTETYDTEKEERA